MNWLKKTIIGLLLLSPSMVRAQIIPPKPDALPNWGNPTGIAGVIMYVIGSILLPLAGIIVVLFIIIGGYQYIFSGANEDLAEKGKKTLTNAVIGLVIIILSYVIVRVVATTFGVSR